MSADRPTADPGLPRSADLRDVSAEAFELDVFLRAHAHELQLSAETIDLLLAAESKAVDARKVLPDESERRVKSLLARSQVKSATEVGAILRSHREDAGLPPKIATLDLGISERALERIEEGSIAMLLNLDPAQVAAYLGRIEMDPTPVVRAALRANAQSAWGYTPGDHSEGRPQAALDRTSFSLDPACRKWIETFIRSWSAKSS